MAAALATYAIAARAQAQDPQPELDPQGQLEAQARAQFEAGRAGDRAGFEACAKLYLEVYNTYDEHKHADTLLWQAALCSEAAGALGEAVHIRKILLERYPDSAHASEVLLGLGDSHASIAMYEPAAEYYEQFATRYRKDTRTPAALDNAYLFRIGLEQSDAARRDLAALQKLYATKHVAKAAEYFWSGRELLDSSKQRRQHALDYLDTFEWQGGYDREVVAHAVIAQIDWRRSCREPLLFDACISLERSPAKRGVPGVSALEAAQVEAALAEIAGTPPKPYRRPKRCGGEVGGVTLTVHKRNAKLAEAAQKRFKLVLRLAKNERKKIDIPENDRVRIEAFKSAQALAMVYRADQEFEAYLALDLPAKLDFYVDGSLRDSGIVGQERLYRDQLVRWNDSLERLGEFFERKAKLGWDLAKDYAEVKGTGSPYWVLAGASRSAMVYETFADQLHLARIPRGLRGQEQVAAYCDALADYAAPLMQQAMAAWEYCTDRSTEFQYFSEFSRECETRQAEHDPHKYPATKELFGESVYAGGRLTSVGLLPESGVPDEERVE